MPRATPAASADPASVRLQIGELSLHGFAGGPGRRIAGALQQSLSDLLSSQGLPPSFSRNLHAPRAATDTLRLARGATPERIGQALARAILDARTEQER